MARDAKKTPQYDLAVANIGEEFERAHAIIVGAEWSLRRSPDSDGIRIAAIDVWRARVAGPGFPSHFIYYDFDDSEIRFLTIKPCGGE